MKKILLFILMFSSIILLSSCGKKKTLTKRTMNNFLEDFSFAEGDSGKRDYNMFSEYIKTDKRVSNEVNQHTSAHWSRVSFYAEKKVIIEKISYTVYNKSTETNISVYEPIDNNFSIQKGSKYNSYWLSTSETQLKSAEIEKESERNFAMTFEKLIINKGNAIHIMLGFNSYDKAAIDAIIENAGVYNLNIEYSVYI